MRSRLRVAVTMVGLSVAALSLLGCSSGEGDFSVENARAFKDFSVFYPGESVAGYELAAVDHSYLGPMHKDQRSVLFLYGTCEVPQGAEGGCAPPVQVSNEPACATNLGLYRPEAGSPTPNRRTIGGAPVGSLEGGTHIELQTGTTTIVIFAESKRDAMSVARNLRGLNVDVSSTDPLPPPSPGALAGGVPCPR